MEQRLTPDQIRQLLANERQQFNRLQRQIEQIEQRQRQQRRQRARERQRERQREREIQDQQINALANNIRAEYEMKRLIEKAEYEKRIAELEKNQKKPTRRKPRNKSDEKPLDEFIRVYRFEPMQNVLDFIETQLSNGYAVEITNARVQYFYNKTGDDREEINQYLATFYNISQFQAWFKHLVENYDMNLSVFSGRLKMTPNEITLKHERSKQGMGTNVMCEIAEYKDEYCYIPSDGNCFYKCVQFIYGDKAPRKDEYGAWLYDSRTQRGLMTNSRIGRFNEHFNLSIGLYNTKNRGIEPKSQRGIHHDWLLINYFHTPDYHIGHYCLISNKQRGIALERIKDNYKVVYKNPTLENVKELKMFNTPTNPNKSNVYIFDFETYLNYNQQACPYAVGLLNYNDFSNKCNETPEQIKKLTKILISDRGCDFQTDGDKVDRAEGSQPKVDCVRKMFKYLGTVRSKKIVLIAHNSSRFDSYIPLFCNIKPIKILKTPRGILSITFVNDYASKEVSAFINKDKKKNHKDSKQTITMLCSYQHASMSLKKFCSSMTIREDLRKTSMVHDITEHDYLERMDEWYEYLQFDLISLCACIHKYNEIAYEIGGMTMFDTLTCSSLTLKCWFKDFVRVEDKMKQYLKTEEKTNYIKKVEEIISPLKIEDYFDLSKLEKAKYQTLLRKEFSVHSHTNPYIRRFMRDAVKGGRVFALINKYESDCFQTIVDVVKAHLKTPTSDPCEVISSYIKSDMEEKKKIAIKLKKQLGTVSDCLMNFDGVSLYPSAMSDKDSEYPRAETARVFDISEEKDFLAQFNSQTFRPKTAVLKIMYENPNTVFLQHLPSKDKEKFYNPETKANETKTLNRFRNGKVIDTLCSVDIQEIVRMGGKILKIYSGIVYEKNYDFSPFQNYITNLFEMRKVFKKENNEAGSELVKTLLNSLYGKTVQRDITFTTHLWNLQTLKTEYDDTIKSYEKICDDLYYVEKNKDTQEYVDEEEESL
ncbi:hypothetical protein BOX15_Mlig030240g1 [Macrostomum lignano]|uniref:DNA-directed DNA polymerase n=1 Tax=Macrostomum lignano TaxID=282301 RepID=A0A267DIP4_9PLAT|nr:hypothetical protein BOX15_Mlig030240g1 [Macrostomum lignano]